jgi:hypothetical protein
MGGHKHVLIIPAPARRKPKPAQVIPISTTVSQATEATGADARLKLHSAPKGVMNVLTTNSGRRSNMKTLTIDSENKVTVLDSRVEAEQNAAPGDARFSSIDELVQVTQDWPLARLVAVWNGQPGLSPVSKFTDRRTAITRIWKALQDPVESTDASHAASARRRGSRRTKAVAREGSKKARILSLLKQSKGATLPDLMSATGWQAHSVRGFISGHLVKRMGLKVNSTRRWSGQRSYHIIRG